MSDAAHRQSKDVRRRCQTCEARKARFRVHGTVKADRDHTLCFACFRAARDRLRSERLAAAMTPASVAASAFPWLPAPPRTLTARAIAHRQRMLAYLTAGRRASS